MDYPNSPEISGVARTAPEIRDLPKHVHGRDGKSYEYAPRKRLEEEATPHLAYEAYRAAIGDGSGERVRVFRRVAGFASLSRPNRQDSD
jgi:hypothetical protein